LGGGADFPRGEFPQTYNSPQMTANLCALNIVIFGGGNKLQIYHGQRTSAVTCRTTDSIHFTANGKQVCVQLPTYADNVALPASAHCTCYMQYPSIFGGIDNKITNISRKVSLMDNKHGKLFVIQQSKRCKLMPLQWTQIRLVDSLGSSCAPQTL